MRQTQKGKTDQRLSIDHFDTNFKLSEFNSHMLHNDVIP